MKTKNKKQWLKESLLPSFAMCVLLKCPVFSHLTYLDDKRGDRTRIEYVLFGTRQRLVRSESHSPLCMEGKEVNQVKSFKYLRVLLDECLSFNDHISYLRSKVASRLGLLSRLRGCLTTEAANKIYLSTVLPILSYCDTCFCPLGSTNRKTLERLQRRAAKIVDDF
jgi:hypothetical protein